MDGGGRRAAVVVAAARASWEPAALRALAAADLAVLKRCVDLTDLLATAATGQADVAVVAPDLIGLDADAVQRLRRSGTRVLAVLPEVEDAAASPKLTDRLVRLGIATVDAPDAIAGAILGLLRESQWEGAGSRRGYDEPAEEQAATGTGRIVAVWGPAGAPGRTTVAVTLAAEHAAAGHRAILLDADPYSGAVGQHLGVLDEVSGLLAAARLANEGALDTDSFARCRRRVADDLEVLTGLPRPDRWMEVRAGVIESITALAAQQADVVVDCGFCLEEGDGAPIGRNTMTLEAVQCADEIVLVGSAEPTGLTRLVRALVDLADVAAAVPVRVVVNRMRDSLGWRRQDIVGMIEGYASGVPVAFWPEDRAGVDRALVAGRALAETGDSPLRAEASGLAQALFGVAQTPKSRYKPVNV